MAERRRDRADIRAAIYQQCGVQMSKTMNIDLANAHAVKEFMQPPLRAIGVHGFSVPPSKKPVTVDPLRA